MPTVSRSPVLLAAPLLTALMACSSTPQPTQDTSATLFGQVILPTAFVPSGLSAADVYAKTRVWVYDASGRALTGAPVDASGQYSLSGVPTAVSGERLVAVIGAGDSALGMELALPTLNPSVKAHFDVTLQSTLDNQYANDPGLKASFDKALADIWQKAFADQGVAPVDPAKIPANSVLLLGPDLSADPSGLGTPLQAAGLHSQGFLDGVGNFFGGIVKGVGDAVSGAAGAVVGGVSYVFNGMKDAIAKVTTPQEPRLIVDYDTAAEQLTLTGIGGRLISQDGGGLISQDGGSIVSHDAGGIVSHDAGGIVASGAGNVISNDGASVTGQALTAQASTFSTVPVGGVARYMGKNEKCVSATQQLTCVLVGGLLKAAVGEKAAVAIADAAMQAGNLRISYTLAQLLDAAAKQAAIQKAIQAPATTTPPAAPNPVTANLSPANQKPVASLKISDGSGGAGSAPYAVSFDGSASNDPDGSVAFYVWSFSDGAVVYNRTTADGKAARISHTFMQPGNHLASLAVIDNHGAVSDVVNQPITVFAPTKLGVIGDPSPSSLSLSAPVGGSATASVSFSNLGAGTLNADANPGSGWLSVTSNTPKPLAPGQTATVKLKATCTSTAGTLSTDLTLTANDSRIPKKTVTVNLTCVATQPLGLGVTAVGSQNVPPYGTATNPAVVSGTTTIFGYVQAGSNDVNTIQVVYGGQVVGQKAVSVPAGTRQDSISQADLNTTQLPDGTYTFTLRAVDTAGQTADTAPVVVKIQNTATSSSPAISEITAVGRTFVSPGQPPVTVQGTTQITARLYGGSKGYSGNVYLCLQRGNPSTTGSVNTAVDMESANIQANAVYDFAYLWKTTDAGNTPTDASYDSIFLSGSQKCDDISNPATTSVIRIKVAN